jgi:2-oxoisovalerate ferredoxin oxidoreductase gamma subunit
MGAKQKEELTEIRLQGRGGQGVVTAGDLLGRAAIFEGKFAQSIPTFGPERRGALSTCSLRISNRPILLKCSSTIANAACILDPTIWHFINITAGLTEDSVLVFNTTKSPEEIQEELTTGKYGYKLTLKSYSLSTVDATGIALEIMGRAITNTAMMGAFARATGWVRMESVTSVLQDRFGDKADLNVRSAMKAYDDLEGGAFSQ